jgi:hypothetical protein
MDPQTLATARDLALVLLIVEAFILALPLVIIPFYILRYLPRVKAPIRPNLRIVRQKTEQVERVTKAAMGTMVLPFLWTAATTAALKRGLLYIVRRR